MNENNLNYYSRKSPVKRRKNLPPGTLLNYDYKLSTPPATSRVKRSERPEHLRDKAESYSCPNRSFIDNQILIIDDDCFNVPSEEILIVDDDEDIMIDVSQPIEEREEEEEDEYYEKQRYQDQKSVSDDLNSAKLKEKDQKQIKQIKLANDKIIEQKGEKQNKGKEKDLSRIFSFGNEKEVETYREKVFDQTENSAHGLKEPLVRRLFSSDLFERREMNDEKNKIKQNYSRASTSRIQKEKEKVFQQKRSFEKKNENSQMEDWQKMIVKFIHKRSENLQIQDYLKKEQASLKVQMIKDLNEENQKENNDESIQEKNSEKQSQILISSEVKKNQNQNETQISHKTFQPQKTMKEDSEEIPYFKTTQSLLGQQVKKAEGNLVKDVQEQPRELVYASGNKSIKTLEKPFQRYMISIDHPELNLQPYEHSLQLLQPVLHKLPESLLPTYLNLYRTLMEKKMKLTQKMTHQDNTIFLIKLMTELHKRFIKFDDYVLEQSKKNKKQTIIRINHEIILALVRMLSRNL